MENVNKANKLKSFVVCLIFAFVAISVLAIISFVKIGNARRANADLDRQIVYLQTEQSSLKDNIDYLESDQGKDDSARDQDMIPSGGYEINITK